MIYVLFFILIGLTSVLQGITGFGFAIIAAPIAILFLPPEALVVSLTVVSLCLNTLLVSSIKAKIDTRQLAMLLVAALAGIPVGIWLLNTAPLPQLKLLVGALTIVFAFVLIMGRLALPRHPLIGMVAGFLTGALQVSIGASGPPVVLYMSGLKLPKDQTRRSLSMVFLGISIMSLPFFVANNNIKLDYIGMGVATIPAVYFGSRLGNRLAGRIPVETFRLLTFGLLVVTGVLSLVDGL